MNNIQNASRKFDNSKTIFFSILFIAVFNWITFLSACSPVSDNLTDQITNDSVDAVIAALYKQQPAWTAPDISTIPENEKGKEILYGRNIIIHTSKYFGPNGSISKSTNGLNCQNCHFEAGTRLYGNNLAAVSATYPKFLPRAGTIITTAQKINECFLRSLNGSAIDTAGKEMQALIAYINWLGIDVKPGKLPAGTGGINAPPLMDRAANPANGERIYTQHCARCHGNNGHGQFASDVLKDEAKQQGGSATADDLYYYPPLWGPNSYNAISTIYRISKFAGFVRYNMPYPVTYKNPVLTDEQAWDVAAYVNSMQHPLKDVSKDYASDISKKPYDFPFGPYADDYTEAQHKYGPFTEMSYAKH